MNEKIQFLNHSCVLIISKKVKILCDPWFKSDAFDNGWSLLYEESHDINDLDFDYIFISHEHPDHFNIPTLKSLKKKTTFIYQKTEDKKVKKFLELNGHTVIEIQEDKTLKINDLHLNIFIFDGYDSALLVEFLDGKTFLNINDSRVDLNNDGFKIKRYINKKIDLVAFQYTYANWAGNYKDLNFPKFQQKLFDKKNDFIINNYKPKKVMLFASFIYFSHEENFYWNENDFLNHAYEKLITKAEIIIPRPNQFIELHNSDTQKTALDNQNSIRYWKEKRDSIKIKNYTAKSINLNNLKKDYFNFYDRLWSVNDKYFLAFDDVKIICHLRDMNTYVEISLTNKKFIKIDKPRKYDFSVSTETLCFLFKNNFSRGTVLINGRIQFNYDYAFLFFVFFFLPYANNIGKFFNKNYPLTKNHIQTIENTAVLNSLFLLYPNSKINYKKFIKSL